jgi:hypothetical protein
MGYYTESLVTSRTLDSVISHFSATSFLFGGNESEEMKEESNLK